MTITIAIIFICSAISYTIGHIVGYSKCEKEKVATISSIAENAIEANKRLITKLKRYENQEIK